MKKTLKISESELKKSMKIAQREKTERVLDNLKAKGDDKDGGTFTDKASRQPKALREKTIKNLRDEAKKLGLSTGGTKIAIFNRLKKHQATKVEDSIVIQRVAKKEVKNSAIETLDKKINKVTIQLNGIQERVNEIHKTYTEISEARDIKLHELEKLKITSQNLKDIL